MKPVVTEGAESVPVYLPPGETYYDYFTYTTHVGTGSAITIPAPLDKIPLLMKAGHIFPRKDRPRRSSGLMRWDPYTLVVSLGSNGEAEGDLYVDDGESYDYEDGAYIHRHFTFSSGTFRSSDLSAEADVSKPSKKRKAYLAAMTAVRVEKMIVVGAPTEWKGKSEVKVQEEEGAKQSRMVEMKWFEGQNGGASWAVVRDPGMEIGKGWTVEF